MRFIRTAVALVPPLALTIAIPFANRVEPRVFGMPFLLAWIIVWILLTPACYATVYHLEGRARR